MTERLLCKKEVCFRLGISRATLDRRRIAGTFPPPIKGPKMTDHCYWPESEVEAHIRNMPREHKADRHAISR